MQNFKELLVWQKSHRVTLAIYELTTQFPRHEQYGLTAQIRRAAMSMTTYIADGAGRNDRSDFVQSINGALAFGTQLEYELLLARDLGLLELPRYDQMNASVVEVKKMLVGLKSRILSTHD